MTRRNKEEKEKGGRLAKASAVEGEKKEEEEKDKVVWEP